MLDFTFETLLAKHTAALKVQCMHDAESMKRLICDDECRYKCSFTVRKVLTILCEGNASKAVASSLASTYILGPSLFAALIIVKLS